MLPAEVCRAGMELSAPGISVEVVLADWLRVSLSHKSSGEREIIGGF